MFSIDGVGVQQSGKLIRVICTLTVCWHGSDPSRSAGVYRRDVSSPRAASTAIRFMKFDPFETTSEWLDRTTKLLTQFSSCIVHGLYRYILVGEDDQLVAYSWPWMF